MTSGTRAARPGGASRRSPQATLTSALEQRGVAQTPCPHPAAGQRPSGARVRSFSSVSFGVILVF